MKTNFLSALDFLPYFTIEAARQLFGDSAAAGSVQTALYRWMKAGQIISLKKGVYMSRRFYELHRADVDFAPMVSAILMPQSYLSLEYILQRHGILTDITYPVTAITPKQPRFFENQLGTFTYRNLKPELYTGFVFSNFQGIVFAQATPAKALFDYLYLRSWKNEGGLAGCNLAEELRLNLDDFSDVERDEFAGFVKTSRSKKMSRILDNLRTTIWQL